MNITKISPPILFGAAVVTMATVATGYVILDDHAPHQLEIYIFALKQGRSLFIRTPDDRRILIDGGGNTQVIQELSTVLPFYSKRIDVIIATHTEARDISGLIDVIGRYEVGRAYLPRYTLENNDAASSTDVAYETLLSDLKRLGIPIDYIGAGDRIPLSGSDVLSESPRASLNVLFPIDPSLFSYSRASPPEVLFYIEYGSTVVFVAGEASMKIQKYLVSENNASSYRPNSPTNISALVVSHSALEHNMSPELTHVLRPTFLIYDRSTLLMNTKKTPSKSSKAKQNPLAGILDDNKFNLKEIGTLKIESDGRTMAVKMI